MPSLLSLPNELILDISDNLLAHDTIALLQTNRRLSSLLEKTLLTELFRSRSFTQGRRLLYQLSAQRDLGSVAHLIERGILDFTDPETLLHGAVRSESVHVLETLLHFGLEADVKDAKSRTPLSLAAKHGRADFASVLAARQDVDVDSEDYRFMTPLLIAVHYRKKEVVRTLVHSGNADLQKFCNMTRKNCLHQAALWGYLPIVRFLLDFMDPNVQDYFGQTALHLAATEGNYHTVAFLLGDDRVDANAQDLDGETVLHAAVVAQQRQVVELLLSDPRVEINKTDSLGQTALHTAAYACNVDIIGALLSCPEVRVNLCDESPAGNTALHVAMGGDSPEAVQLFLESGRVDITARNRMGKAPLDLAVGFVGPAVICSLL